MKKNTKCTILILAALLVLLLTGCGNGGSSSSNGTANTGGGTSEDSDIDSVTSDSEDASEDSDIDLEALWYLFNSATIDGQTVFYGPITITLPEGYATQDESASTLYFYAMDSSDAEFTPYIGFQMSSMVEYSSDTDANKKGFVSGFKATLPEGFEFKELASYDETEVGRYKAMKFQVKVDYTGIPLVIESFMIFQKSEGMGKSITIVYTGLESDTERLAAFEASLDGISERTDTGDVQSGVSNPTSDWQSKFNIGNSLSVNGNTVTYGPLQMELPNGYTVEDETAESPNFIAADGSSLFNFMFTEDSYHLMSDKEYAEKGFKEEIESNGMTDVSVDYYEAISVDGYNGYDVGIKFTNNGAKMIEYASAIFESTDETTTPVLMVTWVGSEETAQEEMEEIEAAFGSIQLVSE